MIRYEVKVGFNMTRADDSEVIQDKIILKLPQKFGQESWEEVILQRPIESRGDENLLLTLAATLGMIEKRMTNPADQEKLMVIKHEYAEVKDLIEIRKILLRFSKSECDSEKGVAKLIRDELDSIRMKSLSGFLKD